MDPKLLDFLRRIARNESSSGANTDHEVIHGGSQAGQKAIGAYGILPNTVQSTLQRLQDQRHLTPQLHELQSQDDQFVRDRLMERPELQEQIATELAKKVLANQHGDPERAAYAWNQGDNLKYGRLDKDKADAFNASKEDADGYVNRFNRPNPRKPDMTPQFSQVPQLEEDTSMMAKQDPLYPLTNLANMDLPTQTGIAQKELPQAQPNSSDVINTAASMNPQNKNWQLLQQLLTQKGPNGSMA